MELDAQEVEETLEVLSDSYSRIYRKMKLEFHTLAMNPCKKRNDPKTSYRDMLYHNVIIQMCI